MEEKKDKSEEEEIVRSIKLLESVLKTTPDINQKMRVKSDINSLRKKLKEMYPDANLKELEDAIFSSAMTIPEAAEKTIKTYDLLKNINTEIISSFKEDYEINEAASILQYFEEYIWIIISDQHTKLDFSNSSDRDVLYRKLDECNRSLKTFSQTIEDLERARASENISQLHLMRARHGRLFLFEAYYFFKSTKDFLSNLITNYELGGNMVLNPTIPIRYEDYEQNRLFENWTVIDSLIYMNNFIDEVLDLINIPDIKKF